MNTDDYEVELADVCFVVHYENGFVFLVSGCNPNWPRDIIRPTPLPQQIDLSSDLFCLKQNHICIEA